MTPRSRSARWKRGEARGVALRGLRVVARGLLAEERRQHRADAGDGERDARAPRRLRDARRESRRELFEARVRSLVIRQRAQRPQRGEAGGHRQRIAGERARLVDVAGRRHALEQRARPAVGADGQATADDLAECREVRAHAAAALRALPADAEAGHHLVEDEQGAVRIAERAQRLEKAGRGLDDAHVAGDGLDHDGGDGAWVRVERGRDGGGVVERREHRLRGERRRHARRVGQPERGDARAGGGQQPVGVAVVAALELHDQVAAGRPARQPQRAHHGLGARVHEAHHLDRRQRLDDELGELGLGLRRRAERGAVGRRGLHGRDHGRVCAAEDQRAERSEVVDVLVAVDVGEQRARAARDHHGVAADGPGRRAPAS